MIPGRTKTLGEKRKISLLQMSTPCHKTAATLLRLPDVALDGVGQSFTNTPQLFFCFNISELTGNFLSLIEELSVYSFYFRTARQPDGSV